METVDEKPSLEMKIEFLRKNREILVNANGKQRDEEEGYVHETTHMIKLFASIEEDLIALRMKEAEGTGESINLDVILKRLRPNWGLKFITPAGETLNQQLAMVHKVVRNAEEMVAKMSGEGKKRANHSLRIANDILTNLLGLKNYPE